MADDFNYEARIDVNVDGASRAQGSLRSVQRTLDALARSGDLSGDGLEKLTRGLNRASRAASGSSGTAGGFRKAAQEAKNLSAEVNRLQGQMQGLAGQYGVALPNTAGTGTRGRGNGNAADAAAAAQANQALAAAQDKVATSARGLAAAQSDAAGDTSQAARAARELDRAYAELNRSEQNVRAAIRTGDPKQTAAALNQQATATDRVSRATQQMAAAQRNAAREADNLRGELVSMRYANYDVAQTTLAVGAAIGTSLVAPTVFFAQWESGMTGVERTTGLTGARLEELEGQLDGLARTMPVVSGDILDMASRAGQLGIAADQVDEFTETLTQFVAVSDTLDATEAAEYIARIGNLTGTEDWNALASAIALVGVNSAATDQQIVDTAEEIAQAGSLANLSAQDVIGLSGALASLAVPPERARSVLFSLFTEVNRGIAGLSDTLPQFASIMGLTVEEVTSLYQTDPSEFIVRLSQALGATENMTAALDALGLDGARAQPVFAALSNNIPLLTSALNDATKGYSDATEVQRQFALVQDDLASTWQIFLNNLQLTAAELGEHFAPAINDALYGIIGLAQGISDFIQTPVGSVVADWAFRLGVILTAALALRAGVALLTASMALFGSLQVGTSFFGAATGLGNLTRAANLSRGALSGVTATAIGTNAVLLQTGASANVAAAGMSRAEIAISRAKTAALAFGRATLIIGALVLLTELVFNFQGAMRTLTDILVFASQPVQFLTAALLRGSYGFAQVAQAAVRSIPGLGQFAGVVDQVASRILRMLNLAGGMGDVLRNGLNGILGVQKVNIMPTLDDPGEFEVPDPFRYWEDPEQYAEEIQNVGDAAGDAADKTEDLAEKVRTLVDYANDLRSVFSRAFEIRFSSQSTYDDISQSFLDLTERFEGAADSIRDLRQEINELNASLGSLAADLSKQRYFLSIATEYSDDARAEQIRARIAEIEAEMAGKRNDLADKTADLADAEQDASRTLVGNSKAAIQNRKAITGLVSEYQEHLAALASSGKSQEEVAQAARALKQEFLDQARAMGYSEQELQPYLAAFDDLVTIIDRVPRNVTIEADVNPAITALNEFMAKIEETNQALSDIGGGGIGGGGIGGLGDLFGGNDQVDLNALRDAIRERAAAYEQVIEVARRPKPRRNRGDLRAVRKEGENLWEQFVQGVERAAENREWLEPLTGYGSEEFARAWEANLGLDIAVTRLGPKINQAMRNNGIRSRGEYVRGFEQNLDLRPGLTRAGDAAAPALRATGVRAGGFFREGFGASGGIGDLIGYSAAVSDTSGFRGTGQRSGHSFRYGFSESSYTFDLVAQSARNAGTSDFENVGRNAGYAFRAGFKTTGSLDIQIEVPGVKINNNGLGKLKLFSDGGFTGRGGKYDPAGIVHKGEYVVPKHEVNQATGLPYADAFGRLARGSRASNSYASGGYVSGNGINGTQMVRLDSASVHAVARAVQHITVVGDAPVAAAAGRGNAELQRRGGA